MQAQQPSRRGFFGSMLGAIGACLGVGTAKATPPAPEPATHSTHAHNFDCGTSYVYDPVGSSTTFVYDSKGGLMKVVSSLERTTFIYDGSGRIVK
jgi:hypothetical protein